MHYDALASNLISDQEAREIALDPTQSFIVQAPAGSGKTGLLTQRFLKLLAYVKVPEVCLGITFTRKAAIEMRDRILEALKQAEQSDNLSPPTDPYALKTWRLAREAFLRNKSLGWALLENPSRLKIQTLDAFCAGLTRQMPIISQLGGATNVTEVGNPLYQIAAGNLLKALETDEPWAKSVQTLLTHLDNNLLLAERLLADLLGKRDQWLPYIGDGQFLTAQKPRAVLESALQDVIHSALFSLTEVIPPGFEKILGYANFAAEKLRSRAVQDSKIINCIEVKTWPGKTFFDLPVWQGIAELLLTQDQTWRKIVTEKQGFPAPSSTKDPADKAYFQAQKNGFCELLTELQKYPRFLEALQRLRECPPPQYDEAQWEMVKALVKLLPILTGELSLVFQERGIVDFTEISLRALKALGEEEIPTDLALGLDYKIQHILVDEFQDTSLSQFRLLQKLTLGWQPNDGRSLFLVGDPMQSIYRFRQAEVGLFIRAKRFGIHTIPLKALTLTANFRADPLLVDWVNRYFKKAFPSEDNIQEGAIAYSPSVAIRESEVAAAAEILDISLENEAQVVVELLKKTQKADPMGSLAVLVRSRTHLQTLLPALREAEIPYQGVQLELLNHRPIVQDLLTLTRALLHLGDRIAWLSLFRTPWGRISLTDIFEIANHAPDLPIWYSLQFYSTIPALSAMAKDRLAFIVPILSQALREADRLPLRSWIAQTWIALGGAGLLYDSQSIDDAEAFFSILEASETSDWLEIREVSVLEQRLEALYAKPPRQINIDSGKAQDNPRVQIMTIHKAKGLEFDTVIVPGIGRRSLSDPSRLLLWAERMSYSDENVNHLILAPIQAYGEEPDPIYRYLRRVEARRAEFETLRLWYVAATRARKRLYWLRHEMDKKDELYTSEVE